MIARVLRFVRLPLLLLLIFAVARFALGANGVPYAPRGNAMFSIVGLSFVSAVYFGALSRRVGGFGWGGTALVGYAIGLWAQILIFTATWLSYAMGIEASYFRRLGRRCNVPEGTVVAMATAMQARAGGLAGRSADRHRPGADRAPAERPRAQARPAASRRDERRRPRRPGRRPAAHRDAVCEASCRIPHPSAPPAGLRAGPGRLAWIRE